MLFVNIFLSLPNLVQEEKITKILSVITIILSHTEFFFFNQLMYQWWGLKTWRTNSLSEKIAVKVFWECVECEKVCSIKVSESSPILVASVSGTVFKAKLCAHLFLHSDIKGIWLNCESIKYEKKKKGDDCDGNEIHQNFSCTFCLQGSQSEPGVYLETYGSPPSPACNYFVQGILHPLSSRVSLYLLGSELCTGEGTVAWRYCVSKQ